MYELYSYFRSSCSWRVRLVLALKRVQYEYRSVNLLKGEHTEQDGELARCNPLHQVPVLVVKDGASSVFLTQSTAITELLELKHPQPPLLPVDHLQRATVRQICAIIETGIQPLQNLSVLKGIEALAQGKSIEDGANTAVGENARCWARDVIARGLQAVEAVLALSAGRCCVGDHVTLADCYLVPQVYNARRFNVSLTQCVVVQRVCCHLDGLPEFQAARPSQQPDCPEHMRDSV